MATSNQTEEAFLPQEAFKIPVDTARGQNPDQDTSLHPGSSSSSPKSMAQRRTNSPLSLDLAALPPLSAPAPPSNTLLITRLTDPRIFHPASIATIRQHITSLAPLHSFSPLRSFRRIICSFYNIDDAIRVRRQLDDAPILGEVYARVYFGEPTPVGETKKFLERPDAGRLFFISPPPSPPVGWEAREEDAPNKEVVADDLAKALGKLSGKMQQANEMEDMDVMRDDLELDNRRTGDVKAEVGDHAGDDYAKSPLPLQIAPSSSNNNNNKDNTPGSKPTSAATRSRSSTMIYDPEAHGDSPGLPAVMVEDTSMLADDHHGALETSDSDMFTDSNTAVAAATRTQGKISMTHTSRPPIELAH